MYDGSCRVHYKNVCIIARPTVYVWLYTHHSSDGREWCVHYSDQDKPKLSHDRSLDIHRASYAHDGPQKLNVLIYCQNIVVYIIVRVYCVQGVGAPIGSVLLGSKQLIAKCRKILSLFFYRLHDSFQDSMLIWQMATVVYITSSYLFI